MGFVNRYQPLQELGTMAFWKSAETYLDCNLKAKLD